MFAARSLLSNLCEHYLVVCSHEKFTRHSLIESATIEFSKHLPCPHMHSYSYDRWQTVNILNDDYNCLRAGKKVGGAICPNYKLKGPLKLLAGVTLIGHGGGDCFRRGERLHKAGGGCPGHAAVFHTWYIHTYRTQRAAVVSMHSI